MKIALIQTNPVIGDFAGNTADILAWISKAKKSGCALAVFPELAISGYPPLDLLEREAFISAQEKFLHKLVDEVTGIGVICGFIQRCRNDNGKPLHNSAVLFENKTILSTTQKQLLPTYDVFDEARYFEPGCGSGSVLFHGIRFGVTICEDIWNDKSYAGLQRYPVNPVKEIFSSGPRPDCLINISASPFQMGKNRIKHDIFTEISTNYKTPLLYVNQVGGQDSLVFDGCSLAVSRDGKAIVEAAGFKEDMIIVELDRDGTITSEYMPPDTERHDQENVLEALTVGTRDYVHKCGFRKAVIGLSGGIDSALTAAIACRALGPDNITGIAMPSPYSSGDSVEDAAILAQNLGIELHVIPITDIFEAELKVLQPFFKGRAEDVTEQNIQARIRGGILMAFSNKFGAMLLSTGNKSELAVGYCTLYGDMNGGLAVISDVPKQLVYDLAGLINREREIIPPRTISKAPSAELAPNQKDQDDLPPYETLDAILVSYLEENKSVAEIIGKGFPADVVADVVRRIKINEYKRKQAPLGLKVTSKAFGYGRRYPTASRFLEENHPPSAS